MDRDIERIKRIIGSGQINQDSLLSLMTSLRIILERKQLQVKFQQINLYSNWLVHPHIDKSMVALRYLESLTDSLIASYKGTGTEKYYHYEIIKRLGLHNLQNELIKFGYKFKIGLDFLKEEKIWKEFITLLLGQLIDRPLVLPTNSFDKVKSICDSIKAKSIRVGNMDLGVSSFCFIQQENEGAYKIRYKLTFLNPHYHIVGDMELYTEEFEKRYS